MASITGSPRRSCPKAGQIQPADQGEPASSRTFSTKRITSRPYRGSRLRGKRGPMGRLVSIKLIWVMAHLRLSLVAVQISSRIRILEAFEARR